jgi:hypothetical protein
MPEEYYLDADPENPICDFCSNPHPKWEFVIPAGGRIGTDRILDRDLESMDRDGRWAACDTCKTYIMQRENAKLARHSVDNFFLLYPFIPKSQRNDLIARVRQAHNFFFVGWDGRDPKAVS